MALRFVDGAHAGKNAWWRYMAGIVLILLCWVGGSVFIQIGVEEWLLKARNIDHSVGLEAAEPLHGWAAIAQVLSAPYVWNNLTFVFLGLGIFIALKGLHQRRFMTLISPEGTFRWQRFGVGFGCWFAIAIVQAAIEYWLNPQFFTWHFNAAQWWLFLPLALVLTPIQTSAEEFLFRGYLLQALGLVIRQPMLLSLVVSFPFALVHFSNPEMERGSLWIGLTYFVLATFLAVITLRDKRLELALGVHAANNLFIVLFVNTQDSVLPTPAMILQQIPTDPRVTFFGMIGACLVFYGLVFGRFKPQKRHLE